MLVFTFQFAGITKFIKLSFFCSGLSDCGLGCCMKHNGSLRKTVFLVSWNPLYGFSLGHLPEYKTTKGRFLRGLTVLINAGWLLPWCCKETKGFSAHRKAATGAGLKLTCVYFLCLLHKPYNP